MKQIFFIVALAALTLSSCALDKPTSSGHTYNNMKRYTMQKFNNHVIYPAGVVNMMIKLDEYIGATEEEKQSDAFKWHRENIFHEDDVTFMIRGGLGTVYTYGKRLLDPDSDWKIEGRAQCQKTDDFRWVITVEESAVADVCSIVTYEGKVEEGKHLFSVEVDTFEERYTSYHSDDKVKAFLTTPEGPIKVIDPQPEYPNYGELATIPEGWGVFLIKTERNGQDLDWAEVRYSRQYSTSLMFHTNIE
jgi:hypothetical protein